MTFYSLRTSLRTKHRNSTDQMLFLIKSDIIEHLFFYFCFFIDLSNFYSNQTKPNPKKKKKIPETQIQKISPARSRLTSRSRDGEITTLILFSGFVACVFWVWFGLNFLGFGIFFFFLGLVWFE